MQLSQTQNLFSQFLSAVSKSKLNIKHSQKKMTLIPDAFRKLVTQKNVVK